MAKVNIHVTVETNAYEDTIKAIWKAMDDLHWNMIGNMVVKLKLGRYVYNELLLFDGDEYAFQWLNDWDEGDEPIIILGFILVSDVKVD